MATELLPGKSLGLENFILPLFSIFRYRNIAILDFGDLTILSNKKNSNTAIIVKMIHNNSESLSRILEEYSSEQNQLKPIFDSFGAIFTSNKIDLNKSVNFGELVEDTSTWAQVVNHMMTGDNTPPKIYKSTFAHLRKNIQPREIWIDEEEGHGYTREITSVHIGEIEKPLKDNKNGLLVFSITLNADGIPLFSQLIEALQNQEEVLYRIVISEGKGIIHLYPNFQKDQIHPRSRFEFKPIIPTPDKKIIFRQGEWVLTSADQTDKIASFGQESNACRYYVLYDPRTKRVAATHLDLHDDKEAILEMAYHLSQAGSDISNLQVWGSSNVPTLLRPQLQKIFLNCNFSGDIDNEFIFDLHTGKPIETTIQELDEMFNDDSSVYTEKLMRLRLKHSIPHVLAFNAL